ncbi:MAG: OmpA family protein [Inquilinaceae bacterium]
MNTKSFLGLAVGAAVLSGCVGTDVQRLNNTGDFAGSQFDQQLAMEYRDLANFEANQMADWADAEYFAQKGLAASRGEAVAPATLADWNLPDFSVAELSAARASLVSALDGGARQEQAVDAAIAQSKFDCWVEQQEENIQPDHIAACRDEFFAAMDRMQAEPLGDAAAVYFVFFDFDRAVITAAGQQIIDTVIADYRDMAGATIAVVGHTDLSGPDSYNLALSARRAAAVEQALIAGGIEASRIETDAVGERQPLVETPDGVREPSNRRAEIRFQ